MHSIACVTVMRKDSSRFPNKNIAPFLGIPLYMHTVNFAMHLGYPYYLISDYETLDLPLFVNYNKPISVKCNTGEELKRIRADIIVLLQVTSPLRNLEQMRDVITFFSESSLECAMSVRTITGKYCYVRNKPVNFDPKYRDYDGCERNNVKYETGGTYIFKKCQLNKKHILDSKPDKIMLFEAPYNIDIDFSSDITKLEERVKQ